MQLPPFFIRSMIFNLCFYILTAINCILLLPTLLMPRKYFLNIVHWFVISTAFVEKYVLGLSFEVRGLENLPRSGSFLVASKHQSAYETTKLHILFHDPAIVLKKQLLKIPLWGWYLAKSDVIAIDRTTPKAAIESIQDGARRMAAQGRPIIIFPQGTRVSVDTTVQDKPYKIGIVRMQEATQLPIIPMALNTGVFWPRNSLFKKPGRVIFEFLPPVLPDPDSSKNLALIQESVEKKSIELIQEGLASIPKKKSLLIPTIGFLLIAVGYTINWFVAADMVRKSVLDFQQELKNNSSLQIVEISPPHISGFPFRLKMQFERQKFISDGNTLEIGSLSAQSWPFIGMPIEIKAKDIFVQDSKWSQPLFFENFESHITHSANVLDIKSAVLKKADFEGELSGPIDLNITPYPAFTLTLTLRSYVTLLAELMEKGIIEAKPGMLATVALQAMEKDGAVSANLSRHDNIIYLGPLRIMELPPIDVQPVLLENGEPSSIATKRVKPGPDQ